MSKTIMAVRSALGLGSTRIFLNALNMLSIFVLARLLTPSDFGVVAIATTVLTIILTITELSLFAALVQLEDATRDHIDTAWTMALIRAAAILAFFVVGAWPIAMAYADLSLIPVLLVSGLTGAVMGLHSPLIVLETKKMRFRPLVIFQVISKVLSVAIAIALALAFKTYWAMIIGNAVGALMASLISYFVVPYRPRLNFERVREIWNFSGWLSFKQIVETISWRVDQLAISLMVPRAQLGIYSVSDNLAVIPTREALAPLRQVMFPSLSDVRSDLARLRAAYLRAQAMVGLICMPLGIGLVLVAEPAVRIALGDKWLACVPFVELLGFSYSLAGLMPFTESLAMALGKTKLVFLRQVYILLFRVPMILVGLFTAGMVGAAWGCIASSFVRLIVDVLLARKMLDISVWQQVKPHGTMLTGLLGMAVVVVLANSKIGAMEHGNAILELIGLAAIGAVTYFGIILLLWIMSGRTNPAVSGIVAILGQILPPGAARLISR